MVKDLIRYFGDRIEEKDKQAPEQGPVITISREFGCPAKRIAEKLKKALTQKNQYQDKKSAWKVISKEILVEAAKELKLKPSEIKYVFDYEKKRVFDEILSSQSKKYYKSDRKIRQTIAKVIRSVANQGNVIIVGRGGIAITKDIQKSFHVRLEAPIEWRATMVSQIHKISFSGAKELAIEIDQKRNHFRNQFEGKGTDYTVPDIRFNCMTLVDEEIVDAILKVIEMKKIVKLS